MAGFDKVLRVLAVFVGGALAGACGDNNSAAGVDPEARHCTRAAGRITRDVGDVTIIEAKAWSNEDVRSVRVRFEYPKNEQGLNIGSILCTYDFSLAVRGDKGRLPQAQSIYFRARHLSENELLLLNMGLRGTKPKYKVR